MVTLNIQDEFPHGKSRSPFPSSTLPEYNFCRHCIDINRLRALKIKTDGSAISSDAVAAFKQAVQDETTRAAVFARRVVDEEGEHLMRIIRDVAASRSRPSGVGELNFYKSQAKEIMERLCKLEGFIDRCRLSLEELSKELREMDVISVRKQVQAVGLSSALLDYACVALSDIFESIKQQEAILEEGQLASLVGNTWVPPDSFERSSKKFLVPSGRCFEVRAKVTEQLPVLVMNRQSVNVAVGVPSDFLKFPASSCVSSQYFDNEAFDSYNSRVSRLDGAKAYRIRWYSTVDPPNLEDDVYIERKTHHVDWAAEPSIKERFKLPSKAVQSFIAGKPVPNLSAKQERLSSEIQSELQEKQMHPVLRTVVRRTAFQSTSTNDVRVSFDEDCVFIDEKKGVSRHTNQLSWCSHAKAPGEYAKYFGNFGVMEVKIQNTEKLPAWVNDLEASEAIISLPNLSKFCHGMCTFYYDTGKLTLQPYWFEAVRNGTLGTPKPLNAEADKDHSSVTVIVAAGKETVEKCQSHSGVSAKVFPEGKADQVPVRSPAKPAIDLRPPRSPEPKTFFANERTLLQWISPVSLVLSIAIAMLGWSSTLDNEAQRSMTPMSATMMCLSMVWLAYALFIFFKRRCKIRRQKSDGFDEVNGPSLMVLSLFGLCVLSLILILVKPFKTGNEDASGTVERLGRPCVQTLVNYSGFPALSAEPSGVIYYPTRNSIFVASLHHLFEIRSDNTVVDYHFPGMDIEAVTLDPNVPDTLYLAVENPNQIVALNALTMTLYNAVDITTALKPESQLEAIAVCPQSLCGGGSGNLRFLVGGSSDSLRVIDFGNYPSGFPYNGVTVVEEIDLDALLCRRIGHCLKKDAGRITDLYMSSDVFYALAERDSVILRIPWSATAISELAPAELPQVLSLPAETRGGWQGIAFRPVQFSQSGGANKVILSNDFHGFVKEFEIGSSGLVSTC